MNIFNSFNFVLSVILFLEIQLPPKPPTTTPTPRIHTTPKPRRKLHNNKPTHEVLKVKNELTQVNHVVESEVLSSGVSSEGKSIFLKR